MYHVTRSTRPRFVQVWLNEWPDSEYETATVLQHRLAVTGEQPAGIARVAVEWRTPSCGPSSYGLVGAEYIADPSAQDLLIEIAISADELYNWCEPRGLTTRSGLTAEYGKGVFDGLTGDVRLTLFGPGQIHVSCAAYDVVGSSYMVFHWLSRAVLRLLLLDRSKISEDEFQRLLDFE